MVRTNFCLVMFVGALCGLLLLSACGKKAEMKLDHPRVGANVRMQDVTFHSAALNRDMPYRVILPSTIAAGKKLPAIYLLHGMGGDYRDWSNYSDVAKFAASGLILIMPEGGASYYTNAADRPQDRYEDYIVKDLIADVESKFPVANERANRAIVGVSMGGFGAVKLALVHPELFVFAGGMSSAIDVPTRPFSIKRWRTWRSHRAIFGPWGGQVQRDNDPLVLARRVDPRNVPFLFLTCGDQEGLLPSNRQFARILAERSFHYEFHAGPGVHDWNQWNSRLPELFQSLMEHIRPPVGN